jgi:hypothetical protein
MTSQLGAGKTITYFYSVSHSLLILNNILYIFFTSNNLYHPHVLYILHYSLLSHDIILQFLVIY